LDKQLLPSCRAVHGSRPERHPPTSPSNAPLYDCGLLPKDQRAGPSVASLLVRSASSNKPQCDECATAYGDGRHRRRSLRSEAATSARTAVEDARSSTPEATVCGPPPLSNGPQTAAPIVVGPDAGSRNRDSPDCTTVTSFHRDPRQIGCSLSNARVRSSATAARTRMNSHIAARSRRRLVLHCRSGLVGSTHAP
jgi:hypothetical protein